MWNWDGDNVPLFQVWHPTSLNSTTYNKIGEVQLPAGNRIGSYSSTHYYYASLSLNNSNQIEFQSGDIIGYYQRSNPDRGVWNIETNGYISYSNSTSNPLTLIDISNVDYTDDNYQPLIEVMFGKIKLYKSTSTAKLQVPLSINIIVCITAYRFTLPIQQCFVFSKVLTF